MEYVILLILVLFKSEISKILTQFYRSLERNNVERVRIINHRINNRRVRFRTNQQRKN